MVNELLFKLEPTNPTASPATSPLLNGEWDLVYQGGYAEGLVQSPTRQIALFVYAGGYAPTLFGLTLARLLPDSLLEAKGKVRAAYLVYLIRGWTGSESTTQAD
jgi:hypothetical protein